MRKTLLIAALIAVTGTLANAALDASTLQNDIVLAPTRGTATRTEATLVAAQSFTTNATVTSTGVASASYFGKGEIIIAFGGNADAAYTNVATVVQGPSAAVLTNVVTTIRHGGDSVGISTYEIDFDALTQAYWGVSFDGVTDNAAAYRFAAKAVYDAVPAAAQSTTSDAYDRYGLTGTANFIVSVGVPKSAEATFSGTCQLQSAATSGGSYTNITDASTTITGATGGIGYIALDTTKGHRYLKAVFTTTNDVADVSVTVNSYKP